MKKSWSTYAILAFVFVGSAAITWILQSSDLVRQVAAIPSICALLGMIYQLVRDEAAHVKALAVQHDQQRFALGITSHMADVAFDRQVELCDDFVRELFLALQCLMNDTRDHVGAIKRADAIGDTIRRHAVWITPELQLQLEKFEGAVREIAGKGYIAKNHPSVGSLKEPVDLLFELINSGSAPGTPPKNDLLYRQIIDLARQVLGVKELTDLRGSLLKQSD